MTRLLVYLWAAPTTLAGLGLCALTLATGGRVRVRHGVLEASGGFARWWLGRRMFRAAAMCLGHVILGRDDASLKRHRAHEHGHVRQAEILGPLFLPVYLGAGLLARLRGGHFYHDNPLEHDAERRAALWRRRRDLRPADAAPPGPPAP